MRSHGFHCSVFLFAGLIAFDPAATASAGQYISGPVEASAIRVIDGDTVLVDATPWPNQHVTTYVRLRGIDAPELKSRCPEIRDAAERAHSALEELVSSSATLSLFDISGDKYFGRVVASLELEDGRDASSILLDAGLVAPYRGGRKKAAACP
ncbi:thermonuclease family protein [Rhizobium cremeum]|uniref:thermonuclease family protein n=1 Tax=Rhizobium cremeum TaxID=2813827 RepID=UPI000DE0503B